MSESSFHRKTPPSAGIKPKAAELEELRRARDGLALVNKLNRIITSSLDISQVYEGFAKELRRIIEENKHRQELLEAISRLTRIITSNADITQAYETFAQELKKLAPFDRLSIGLKEEDRVRFLALFSTMSTELDVEDSVPFEGSVLQWLIQHRQTNIENDFLKERKFSVDELHLKSGLRSAMRTPLISKGEVFGSHQPN